MTILPPSRHRRHARDRGNAVVEAALLLPFILLLFGGLLDYASAASQSMALEKAARSGAQYATSKPGDSSGIANVVRNAGDLSGDNLSIETRQYCLCSTGEAVACTGTCSGGASVQSYVSVSVSQPFTPLLPYSGLLTPSTLQGVSTLRMR